MSRIIAAKRTYELDGQFDLEIIIFKAKPDQDDYRAEFQIIGFANVIESYAMGIDEVQALFLAFQKVATILYCSKEYEDKRLTWLGTYDLDLPYVEGLRDLVVQHSI
ncbi:hypothetical protein [Acinetobacter sp. Marseille-Q1618]|uniref:DUF6968 family protein n=1 Tax=Acinetobacter sp. Marseille-Q1618 TaxID=2697502 RepID=UPI00156EB9DF|nr:hypothetical protein [Acinetobacter sp. Marseille-Q1618]